MKCLIVFAALVAVCAGALLAPVTYHHGLPLAYSSLSAYGYGSPLLGHSIVGAAPFVTPSVAAPAVVAAPVVAGVKSQYHAQDELGQASYGHAEPTQAHSAVQDAHGNKVGSFSYVAPDGRVLRTDYVADALGYRVASNALPVGPGVGPAPVADTPEVVAARIAHLAAHARSKRAVVTFGHTPAATAPLTLPLAYTAPLQYVAPFTGPVAYSAVAPAISTGLVREATLTTVVNNPGHAVSYRVD